jgi:hypothetical protein
MAQADQTVQNATFPTVRADINNNLAALFSDNSGATAPSVTVAFQDWIDTSGANPLWKKRNAANNAWITLGTISASTIAFEGTLPSQTGNAGEYLTTDGTVASWASITAAGQLLRAPQVLTSGVSYTTPANCTSIYVEAIGGGGGGGGTNGAGGGGGGGGGAGGYCAKYFTVVAAVSYTYAIGAGGAGGPTGIGSGSAGGNTTFTVGGTTITSGGGAGGGNESSGGAGGTCTNGDMNIAGGGGGGGSGSGLPPSGAGGNSFFGGGAQGRSEGNGFAGTSGGGGSGGSGGSISRTGGAGGAGLIRIWEFS